MNVESRVLELINCNSQIKKDEGFSLLFKEYKSKVFNFLNKKLNYNEEVAKDLLMDIGQRTRDKGQKDTGQRTNDT